MKHRVDALRHEAGFTIIEVMVAIFVLLLGVLGATTLLNTANAETARNQARNGATNLVRDIVEASRALPYDQVNPTKDSSGATDNTILTALQTMAPTSGGSSFADDDTATSGWQIIRRNIKYTVTVQACVIDDAKDKVIASHSPDSPDGTGYYCPNLPTTPTGDSNADDYRRIKVTAAWTSNSCNSCSTPGAANSVKTFSVTQTGVVINPSGGLGPAPVGGLQRTSSSCSSWTFDQKFQAGATGALFTVNDPAGTQFTATVPLSTDVSGQPTFRFTYNLSPAPPDNTYRVEAQAFNSLQQFGKVSVGTAYINCHEPPAVTGVSGGFDWRRCTAYPNTCASGERIFDLDWNSSPDADVVGYYVWAQNGDPDWDNSRPLLDPADTKVACVSRALSPPSDTTTMPGSIDFLESFQPACWDSNLANQPALTAPPGAILFGGTRAKYWLQAVDPDPAFDPANPANGLVLRTPASAQPLANHSTTLDVTENMLNIRPTTPALTVTDSGGLPCLSWTDSLDVNAQNVPIVSPIRYYRVYRDANVVATVSVTYNNGSGTVSANVPDVPYKDRIGRSQPNQSGSCNSGAAGNSWFKDTNAGATNWNYWVTAVDQNYLESFPSNTGTWTAPSS